MYRNNLYLYIFYIYYWLNKYKLMKKNIIGAVDKWIWDWFRAQWGIWSRKSEGGYSGTWKSIGLETILDPPLIYEDPNSNRFFLISEGAKTLVKKKIFEKKLKKQ